jgi:hypothetical protein
MIYNRLLWIILNLVCIGINVIEFFLIVRAATLWKQVSLLVAFNDAGKALVDGYTGIVGRFWGKTTQKQLSLKGRLLIGFVLLELTRVIAVGITKLL